MRFPRLSLVRDKALTASPSISDAIRERQWSPWPLLGGGQRQRIQDAYSTAQSANYLWMYTNSPAVRTVIDTVVRNVGQLDLRLYEEVDEAERQPRPDHDAALSLRYPSNTVPSDQFIRSLMKDYLIFDNAYAAIWPVPNGQLMFKWLPAQNIQIMGSGIFDAEFYRYHTPSGGQADFPPDRMLHWRGENPHDPRLGLSRLETLRKVVGEDAALQQAIVELANAGMTEPAWVFRPLDAPPWSNEGRERFEEDLTNRLRRRNKTPVVLEEGMELKSFGVSPKDAQMIEVRRWAIERVASAYGVPLGMVGLDDNLEAAQAQFYADTLPPLCEEFTRMLNLGVLVRYYGATDYCFEFYLDEKLMGPERLKALVSASGRPVLLTNEARAMINRPPVDNGDELVTPDNVTVGDNPKPSVDVMPIQDPNGPLQDGSHREEPKQVEAPEQKQLEVSTVPRRQADIDRQARNVNKATAAMVQHFARLGRTLRNQKAFDRERWDGELARDLQNVISEIFEHEGGIYAARLGAADFDMRQVEHYVQAKAQSAAEGINEATRQHLAEADLDEVLAHLSERAEVLGASIGATSTVKAREEAAKQSPFPERRMKRWVANTKRHAQYDGNTVRLGDSWPAGFAPGSAPNCHCTMIVE